MVQGVEIKSEEREEICQKIIEGLSGGMGETLYGVVQKMKRVSISEVYRWRKEDPEFDKAIDAARRLGTESMIDLAESKLFKNIHDGDMKSVRFFLERKGKIRGYAARTELTGADGAALPTGVDKDRKLTPQEELDAALEIMQRQPE